jgi:hypothetical protein
MKRRDRGPRQMGHRAFVAGALFLGGFVSIGEAAGTVRQGTIEFVYGQYRLADARFKTIYPSGSPAVGLAFTATLFANFDLSFEVKTLSRRGTLTYTMEETNFRLVPISLGLRFVYPGGILQPFAGGGLDYVVYYENNSIGTTVNATRGSHVQGGLYVQFGARFPVLLVGKAKYVWATADKKGRAVAVGGLEYVLGLALAF